MSDKRLAFRQDIANYWHCEARDQNAGSYLLGALRSPLHPINESEFANLLADAILHSSISVSEYNNLVAVDFESKEDVVGDLRELWQVAFGDREIKAL